MYKTLDIEAPVMPSPLPTAHQDLMNIFYNAWQAHSAKVTAANEAAGEYTYRSARQEEIAALMPPKVLAAVILGNHNYQVGNGGWSQYDYNGYSASVDRLEMLYRGAAHIGIEHAKEILEMIEEFVKIKSSLRDDEYEEGEEYSDPYDALCTRFYALDTEVVMQNILDRFDEVIGYALTGPLRQAA